MKRISTARHGLLALALALGGASTACNRDAGADVSVGEVGGVGFRLSMAAGVSIDTIHYKITGPGSYTKTGDIPVGGSGTTFSAKIDNIPAGDGYTLKLDAVEADGSTKCMGSADFSVVANAVTAVSVRLQCPGQKGGDGSTGSVMVDGTINICAVAQSATATPSSDGSTIALVGVGSDQDSAPAPITYKWTATKGTLTGSDMANVTLNCPVDGGSVDIVFEVSDTDCGDKIQLTGVQCGNGSSSGGAGAGTGGAGEGGAGAGGAGAGGAGAGGAGAGGAGEGGAGAGGAGEGGAGAGGAGAGGAGAGGAGAGGAGAGGAGAGGSGGGGVTEVPDTTDCKACRDTNCTNYNQLGFNLVTGCFSTVDPQFGADATDPMFIQQCVSLMNCAYTKKCGYTVELGASECYCGTASLDTCFSMPTAPNGPCINEFQTAARSTTQTDISVRVSDLAYPLGWANYLLECDTTFCATSCKPQ